MSVFKNSCEKTIFKNYSPMFYRTNICLGTWNVLNLFFVFLNIFLKYLFICNALFLIIFSHLNNYFLKQSLKNKWKWLKTAKRCFLKTHCFMFLRTKNYFLLFSSQNCFSCFFILNNRKLFSKIITKHGHRIPHKVTSNIAWGPWKMAFPNKT